MGTLGVLELGGIGLVGVGFITAAVGLRRQTVASRAASLWILNGLLVTATITILGMVSSVLVAWPPDAPAGLALGWLFVPAAVLASQSNRLARFAEPALVRAVVATGSVALVGLVYVLVVIGLGRVPQEGERTILALSAAAAAFACLLVFPTRRRLEDWANRRIYGDRHSPGEALRTFGSRMSRSVPMDELLLQLVETLRKTMRLTAAEIWTGTNGQLGLAVSVPEKPARAFLLDDEAHPVMARAQAQGNAWLQVWAPTLLEGREDRTLRAVSIAHLGDLLGLIVVERRGDDPPFADTEDRALVDLARQVGLALHNVRLDSALQASLEELQERNAELVASRARIVAASDESRRRIERNLHDGAQQHLVALAVKVGLIRTLLEADPTMAAGIVEELRDDVQATLNELRELAHGIYPPLLRDRGLAEALQTAANRATLPTQITAPALGRYDSDVEAAVYFCCLEAMQNAGKYAGDGASVRVLVEAADDQGLRFEVCDNGAGFDVATLGVGQGFVNMRDRVGAVGGDLTVRSAPGTGTSIRGFMPVQPVANGTVRRADSPPTPRAERQD